MASNVKEHLIRFMVPLLAGISMGVIVGALTGASPKRLVFALSAITLPFLAILSGSPKKFLLLIFFSSIPLNINYFLFKQYAHHLGGANGLYLIPADLPLAGLYLVWGYETVILRRRQNLGGQLSPLMPILFVFILALSIIGSIKPLWGLYELIRWIRYLLILVYLSRNLVRKNVPLVLTGLGIAVILQCGLAISQVVMRSDLGLSTLGVAGRGSQDVFVQQLSKHAQVIRGAGTTGHPNILGTFLILLVPIFVSLCLSLSKGKVWIGSLMVCLAGSVALYYTFSRGAVFSFVGSIAFLVLMLAGFKILSLKQTMSVILGGLIVLMVGSLITYRTMEKRITYDSRQSFRVRMQYNEAAWEMFKNHVFLGVGINNYTLALDKFAPGVAAHMDKEERIRAGVHNLYLLILAETGAFGILGFALLIGGVFAVTLREAVKQRRFEKAVALGILSGLTGASVHNLLEFTLWLDTNLYTLAILTALVGAMGRDSDIGGGAHLE